MSQCLKCTSRKVHECNLGKQLAAAGVACEHRSKHLHADQARWRQYVCAAVIRLGCMHLNT